MQPRGIQMKRGQGHKSITSLSKHSPICLQQMHKANSKGLSSNADVALSRTAQLAQRETICDPLKQNGHYRYHHSESQISKKFSIRILTQSR